MPPFVDSLGNANPMTLLVTSVRGLMAGTILMGPIGIVLQASVFCTAVFALLTLK